MIDWINIDLSLCTFQLLEIMMLTILKTFGSYDPCIQCIDSIPDNIKQRKDVCNIMFIRRANISAGISKRFNLLNLLYYTKRHITWIYYISRYAAKGYIYLYTKPRKGIINKVNYKLSYKNKSKFRNDINSTWIAYTAQHQIWTCHSNFMVLSGRLVYVVFTFSLYFPSIAFGSVWHTLVCIA